MHAERLHVHLPKNWVYTGDMSIKAIKSDPAPSSVEGDQQIDRFIARNREALNEALRRSRAEVSSGMISKRTVEQIIADGRRRARES